MGGDKMTSEGSEKGEIANELRKLADDIDSEKVSLLTAKRSCDRGVCRLEFQYREDGR